MQHAIILTAMEKRRYPKGEEWRASAACRGLDPEIFFPITTTTGASAATQLEDQIEAAKSICRTCPVQIECLEYALTTNQEAGIWGGADEEERRKLRRKRGLRKKPNQNSPTRY
jgi:WhiB family transcriptional regulator, redox-sensing transcriptional regulator